MLEHAAGLRSKTVHYGAAAAAACRINTNYKCLDSCLQDAVQLAPPQAPQAVRAMLSKLLNTLKPSHFPHLRLLCWLQQATRHCN
jgi:hypothetical protein